MPPSIEAIVFATLGRTDLETICGFEERVRAMPNVVEAQRLFGDPDYLRRVLTRDLAAYQEFYDTELGTLPGVQRISSTLVMKRVTSDGTVPLA